MKAKAKAKATKTAAKKRRPARRKSSGFGEAVLASLRDPRVVKSVRRKIAVARRQLAKGQGMDGEAVMDAIIAESGKTEVDTEKRGRSSKPRKRRKRHGG